MTIRSLAIVPLFALVLTGLAACGGGKSNNANGSGTTSNGNANSANGSESARIPNCGAVQAVWVNLNTKAYHEPGDQYYGKTKNGEYLCPSAAKAQGFHPAGGAMMMNSGSSGRHHKRGGSSDSSP